MFGGLSTGNQDLEEIQGPFFAKILALKAGIFIDQSF